ncbi:MAG TPA: NADH-ubiquinone oxidoreductase-F iron-sulfur binding region domain-containing protein [Candidatus Sulfotelmatobacter sp.]|nr:NADH-ubiquinone oxidoreductase-F iron-sulfur binding region domain-containing protein [Candidatus Sulfotelmatobacter sp.]
MIFDDLRAIQLRYGYLPKAELEGLSQRSQIPLYQIHSVASFYPHFHLSPPSRAEVLVCADMSCRLNGACELRAELAGRFAGARAEDVRIRDVSCLGRCDQAPAVAVNDAIFEGVSAEQVEQLARRAVRGEEVQAEHPETARVACASDPYGEGERYGAVRQLVGSRDFDGVLAMLKDAELRGMGGAGFPTWMKWDLVRKQAEPQKYVVCNADESEPGTIKDRFILSHLPHLVLEGMIIAGLVTGAKKGILYIRHEYPLQEEIFGEEIRQCVKAGLLGKNILGSELEFTLEVFVSPGGYICGEESALLEAMEGHRAEPRNKPPFPGVAGLWQKPTVINNVETFANVPQILMRGAAWFKSAGVGGSRGLKFVGVSGHVARPGVFEVPMGTPMREVIFGRAGGIRGGRALKAFAPSGPSSGYLPASLVDVPLDFKALADAGSMLGSGAIVVCDETTCMLDMALTAVKFYRNESCGKCVPCRMGSQKMVELLTRWTRGGLSDAEYRADLGLLEELSQAMSLTSICGLGQIVPAPVQSVLKHFRAEVEAHVLRGECPSGICFSAAGQLAELARAGIRV